MMIGRKYSYDVVKVEVKLYIPTPLRTFESTIPSLHAIHTQHSTSMKFASFDGFILPTEMVYDFLWAFFSRLRMCDMRGR